MSEIDREAVLRQVKRKNRIVGGIAAGVVVAALGLGAVVLQSGHSELATEFGYGTYTAGQDVAAGTYRAIPPALGDPTVCQWTLTRNGAVVEVARHGHEMPDRVVTLLDGDEFETTPTCGTWEPV